MRLSLLCSTLIASAFLTTPLRAQRVDLPSYVALKDSIVARYNRGDFNGVYALSSEAFRRYETAAAFIDFLKRMSQAGPIVSSSLTEDLGDAKYFLVKLPKIDLELTLSASSPSRFDILAINRVVPYDTAYVESVPTDNPLRSATDTMVDRSVRKYFRNRAAAGVSIGVIRDGTVSTYNYGASDKNTDQLPTADTYYEIGSITKTFAGNILAQAVLEGRMNLHDDIRKFLPDTFPNLQFNGQPIEVVELSNHTSGMPGLSDDFFKQQPYDSLNPYAHYSEQMFWQALHRVTIATSPGTRYDYSNYGVALLGYILGRVYGQDFETLLGERITRPLKMRDTKFSLSEKEAQRFARGYNKAGTATSHWVAGAFPAAGGLRSTVNDLLKYLAYNLNEKSAPIRLSHKLTHESGDDSSGLNWFITTTASGHTKYRHNGATGGFRAEIVFLPDLHTGFVVLTNSEIEVNTLSRELTYRLTMK